MAVLTRACGLLAFIVVLALPTAAAALPASVEEHLPDVVRWAYRGSEVTSSAIPSCTSICLQLWAAETELDEDDLFVDELWREARELRIKAHLNTRFSGTPDLYIRGGEATQALWQIGGESRWLTETVPIPAFTLSLGQEQLRLRPVDKGDELLGGNGALNETFAIHAPTIGWVPISYPGGGTYFGYWFTDDGHCSRAPTRDDTAQIPGTRILTYSGIYCAQWIAWDTFVHWPDVTGHVLFIPANLGPPSDATEFDPRLPYRSAAPSSQEAAEADVADQLTNHPDDYRLLLRWLDFHLGGSEFDPLDLSTYLERHEPQYAYDADEDFFSQEASALTDNFELDEGNWTLSNDFDNYLIGEGPVLLAAAGSNDPELPALTLDLLGANYHDGESTLSTTTDYIDARGSDVETYAADSLEMREQGHDSVLYGRVVSDPDDDKVWLQYWTFYYDNSFSRLGFGPHEGDWEMVQVGLEDAGWPEAMTFSVHDEALGCAWGQLERTGSESETPIVYPGRGSHAAYPYTGESDLPWFQTDYHDGLGAIEQPPLHELTAGDDWIDWKGRWGSSTGTFGSPSSPSQQGDKWSHPSRFHSENLDQDGCESP